MKYLKGNWSSILTALFLIVVGILLLVNPAAFAAIIIRIAGILLALLGIFDLIKYFRAKPEEAAKGSAFSSGTILISLGLFCTLSESWFVQVFPVLAVLYGVFQILLGYRKLQRTVDALRLKDEFQSGHSLMNPCLKEDDLENLVIQQIEFCNIILLNKSSEVERADRERIRKILRGIQPKAEIIECDYCDVPLEKIIGTGIFDFDDVAGSAAWIQAVEGRDEHFEDDDDDDEHHHEHEHEHHEHEHHHEHHHEHEGGEVEEYGIGTYVYESRRPFMLNRFDDFVARRWPKSVIRAKGMCYFTEEYDTCYVFEQAGRQVQLRNAGQWYATMPKEQLMQLLAREPELRKDWDEHYGDRMQRLVFIGQHLDKEQIKRELDDCLE